MCLCVVCVSVSMCLVHALVYGVSVNVYVGKGKIRRFVLTLSPTISAADGGTPAAVQIWSKIRGSGFTIPS